MEKVAWNGAYHEVSAATVNKRDARRPAGKLLFRDAYDMRK